MLRDTQNAIEELMPQNDVVPTLVEPRKHIPVEEFEKFVMKKSLVILSEPLCVLVSSGMGMCLHNFYTSNTPLFL
jgi:hypothetical protein